MQAVVQKLNHIEKKSKIKEVPDNKNYNLEAQKNVEAQLEFKKNQIKELEQKKIKAEQEQSELEQKKIKAEQEHNELEQKRLELQQKIESEQKQNKIKYEDLEYDPLLKYDENHLKNIITLFEINKNKYPNLGILLDKVAAFLRSKLDISYKEGKIIIKDALINIDNDEILLQYISKTSQLYIKIKKNQKENAEVKSYLNTIKSENSISPQPEIPKLETNQYIYDINTIEHDKNIINFFKFIISEGDDSFFNYTISISDLYAQLSHYTIRTNKEVSKEMQSDMGGKCFNYFQAYLKSNIPEFERKDQIIKTCSKTKLKEIIYNIENNIKIKSPLNKNIIFKNTYNADAIEHSDNESLEPVNPCPTVLKEYLTGNHSSFTPNPNTVTLSNKHNKKKKKRAIDGSTKLCKVYFYTYDGKDDLNLWFSLIPNIKKKNFPFNPYRTSYNPPDKFFITEERLIRQRINEINEYYHSNKLSFESRLSEGKIKFL